MLYYLISVGDKWHSAADRDECQCARVALAAAGRGGPPASRQSTVVGAMCHAVVLGVLFSLPSYLYSAVPFR